MLKKFLLFIVAFISLSASAQTLSLDSYVRQGLQNSPLLKDYSNQLQLNSMDSAVLNSQRKPQVSANGQIMAAPVYNGWGYDEAVTNTGNYAAQLMVSQDLFAKKLYAPQYNALLAEKQSITNNAGISAHELEKNITDQYLLAYSSLNQLTFLLSTYELMKEEKVVLQKFVEQGLAKQTDYLSFEIAIQTQEIQLKQLQNQYRADLRQLNFICGISDTAYRVLATPGIEPLLIPKKNNSLFLQQFRIDSIKNNNQRALITMNYRPRLSWFADAGVLGYNPALLYKNFGFSFGLNFSMPLYDGRQKKILYQKISISESTRNNYQSFYRSQQALHLQQLSLNLDENDQLILQIRKQLVSAEMLVKASKQLLNSGELAVMDFIITMKNYIDIKSQLNQSELKKLQLTAELNYWNW
ncbi:MAG: TolC family protein [Bacteroidetes bacterium]|nr:TolC family protein [Bacteroidota bacterium]